jgi:hypothetical protein
MSDAAKEKQREYNREYRKKNREKLNAYMREWKKKNPDKVLEHKINHWERKAKTGE